MVAERDEQARRWADLPAPAQARLLALASETIGQLPPAEIPGPLRPFARFAPRRRARLAATALRAALDTDGAFRTRVAERLPEAGRGDPDRPDHDDPATQLAVLFLRRPGGWREQADELSQRLQPEADGDEPAGGDPDAAAEIARLTEQLHAERTRARAAREQAKADIAELKAANVTLRHTLKATRDRLATAEADRDRARTDVEAAANARERHDSAQAAATRRLKARLDDALATAEADKRSARAGRDARNARLRLLLDTIRTAAAGLSRELALPAAEADVAPADTVEMRSPTAAARSMAEVGGDAVRLLAEAIALPHSHLIVDGYNVTKTAWPAMPLADQRARLVTALGGLAGRTGVETTCVFDGADLLSVPTVPTPRGVRVRFSPAGITADDVVRELVDAEPAGRVVLVATSDAQIIADVRRAGATPVPATALVELLARSH